MKLVEIENDLGALRDVDPSSHFWTGWPEPPVANPRAFARGASHAFASHAPPLPPGTVPVVDQLYYNDLIDSGETGKIMVQQLNGILSMLVMGPLVSYLQVAELLLGWSERFTADLGQAARVRAAWLVRLYWRQQEAVPAPICFASKRKTSDPRAAAFPPPPLLSPPV